MKGKVGREMGAGRGKTRGDVPSDIIMFRPYRQSELALRFDAHHQREEKVFAPDAGVAPFGDGEQRARDRTGRVDDCVEVGVVVVVDVACDAIEESCVLSVGAAAAGSGARVSEKGGGGGAEERGERGVLGVCQWVGIG